MDDLDLPITVTSHVSDVGSWERVTRQPSGPLEGLIAGYCGFRQRMAEPAVHRGIPGPTLPLVISFGPSQAVSWDDPTRRPVEAASFLAGIHDRFVLITAEEHHGIQIDLTPVGAYRLLGRGLRELTSEVVPIEAILGADAERLVDDLATAASWQARFDLLDRALVRRLTPEHRLAPELARAWERIARSHGRVRIEPLADELGWSPRRLRARFSDTFGLAPKRMARLTRFSNAASLLSRTDGPALADVALSCGYADQAHLANEVVDLSGLTPTALRAGHLPADGGLFEPAVG